jgi:hypothetical protein
VWAARIAGKGTVPFGFQQAALAIHRTSASAGTILGGTGDACPRAENI